MLSSSGKMLSLSDFLSFCPSAEWPLGAWRGTGADVCLSVSFLCPHLSLPIHLEFVHVVGEVPSSMSNHSGCQRCPPFSCPAPSPSVPELPTWGAALVAAGAVLPTQEDEAPQLVFDMLK